MSTTGRFDRGDEQASDRETYRDEVRLPEVIRSEEELVITRQQVESGRVRLVKRIVTESVTRTLEVRREVLHVERLEGAEHEPEREAPTEASGASPEAPASPASPADRLRGGLSALQRRARREPDADSSSSTSVGPQFAEGEMEIVLMEEEVVFSKRVVPRERVRLRREVVIDDRRIDETLRKEEVELVHEETRTGPPGVDAERADEGDATGSRGGLGA